MILVTLTGRGGKGYKEEKEDKDSEDKVRMDASARDKWMKAV